MVLPEAKLGAYFYFVLEENLIGFIFYIVRVMSPVSGEFKPF
jgi:hypothetical protein